MANSLLRDQGVTGAEVVALALHYQGVKYVWGGTTPAGFDCSGFVQYVYGKFGIVLPRTTYEQVHVGVEASINDLQLGDILFFDSNAHEGMYVGNGMFIHAPHTGDVVHLSALAGYYVSNFTTARRILTSGTGTTSSNNTTDTADANAQTGATVTREMFADAVLAGIAAPLTRNNRVIMLAWQIAEGSSAMNNPYDTTLGTVDPSNGITLLPDNQSGVKQYRSTYQGIQNTVATLIEPSYSRIVGNLHKSADPELTRQAIVASPWGTGDPPLTANLVEQVATNYSSYATQSIGKVTSADKPLGSGIGDVIPGASAITNPLSRLADLAGALLNGSTWIRVAEVVLALAIVVVVLVIALRK